MMATAHNVTSGMGPKQFQATGFLLDRAYITINSSINLSIKMFKGTVPDQGLRLNFEVQHNHIPRSTDSKIYKPLNTSLFLAEHSGRQ